MQHPDIFSEKYRVTTPPMYTLPLQTYAYRWHQSNFPESLGETFEFTLKRPLFDGPLTQNGIDVKDIELVWRFPQGHEDLMHLTVRVIADWQSNKERPGSSDNLKTWERAAVECRNWMNRQPQITEATSEPYPVHIEIIGPELIHPRYFAPPDMYLDRYNSWVPSIKGILERYDLLDHLESMTLIRSGPRLPREENPLTVLITLHRECYRTKSWDDAEGVIRTHLRNQQRVLDVDVSIEWGDLDLWAFELLEPKSRLIEFSHFKEHQEKVHLGANIGAGRYTEFEDKHGAKEKGRAGVGTLGGYIEYQTVNDKDDTWHKAALTCYHVVRSIFPGFQLARDPAAPSNTMSGPSRKVIEPADNSLCLHVDKNGSSPLTLKNYKKFVIEAPSRVLHNIAVTVRTEELCKYAHLPEGATRDELFAYVAKNKSVLDHPVQMLKDGLAFFDENRQQLGFPLITSGYSRRRNAHRMDWAVLQVSPKRQGSNPLPSFEDWQREVDKRRYLVEFVHHEFPGTLQNPPDKVMEAHLKRPYFSKGSRSGLIAGRMSGVKSDVDIREDRYLRRGESLEFTYVSPGAKNMQTAQQGDSGAFVWNDRCQLVGMILGGNVGYRGQGSEESDVLTYVTPIQDIFADIMDLTNGHITAIRVAGA